MKTKTKGFLLTASVCLAMAFTLSCSSDDWLGDPSSSSNGGGEPSSSSNGGGDPSSSSNGGGDPSSSSNGGGNSITYEGETYPTVDIGTQTWLAKNLNYAVAGSKCYDDDPANCQEYGRLYDWETAMSVCPSGWRLPSNEDWDMLIDYAGGSETAGAKLKSISGWNDNGNGTDQYGFTALPGGGYGEDGSFFDIGGFGIWWSASEGGGYGNGAYIRGILYNDEGAHKDGTDKSGLFSVRCVRD